MSNIFIGLGGAGIDAVKAVCNKKQSLDDFRRDRFLLIDTDIHDRNDLPEILREGFVDIGEKSPSQIKADALNSPLKRWFLGWYNWYDDNHFLHEGTGTVRPYGRIGLYGRYDYIYQRISAVLCQSANELQQEEPLNIFVYTGSCGGTGSAIVLDILYMINTILKSGEMPNANRCMNICLVVAMPEMWIDYYKQQPDVQHKLVSNAVAFFTELKFVIVNAETVPTPYYPAMPPKSWMKYEPFSPCNCCYYGVESVGKTKEQMSQDMAGLVCSCEATPDIATGVHNLSGNVLAEWIKSHNEESNGIYSFVDWRFARKVLDLDKHSDVSTEELWDRMCKL